MKIGILGHFFVEWTGGFDFLRMLMEGLVAAARSEDEIHLLLPVRGPRMAVRTVARHLRDRLIRKGPSYPSGRTLMAGCAELDPRIKVHAIDRGTASLRRACRGLGLDVILPSTFALPASVGIPWIGYLGDFQHKHLPHFFSAQTIASRDQYFKIMLDQAPAVIVNSRAVAHEAGVYFPGHRAKVFSMPFSAGPPRVTPTDPPIAQAKYGIAGRYFIISNQFWLHKDHATALRAFGLLARDFRDVSLVCTGEPSDPRDPTHFPRLLALAESLDIRDRLHVLGVVPKADQLGLMKGAVAIVQPTLSEGGPGGGCVFDAVGMGVPSVISDIAVNKEINEREVSFFRVSDEADLCRVMRRALHEPQPALAADTLVAAGRRRRVACGHVLMEAIDHAMAHPHGRGKSAAAFASGAVLAGQSPRSEG
jgi:glycosyltransferase involved in cell wall biosynthesis